MRGIEAGDISGTAKTVLLRMPGLQENKRRSVKNTGRCAELLVPEAEIFVQESDNPERKTKWDLIGGEKRKSSDQYGFPDSKQSRGRMAACRQFVFLNR